MDAENTDAGSTDAESTDGGNTDARNTDAEYTDADPRALAGVILRASRAHAGLSQRELAAKIGVARSTIGRVEGNRGSAPGWELMVKAVSACGCLISIVPDDELEFWQWEFEDVRDQAARHLPAHLEVWRLTRASQWSSFHKYSCFANPPVPPYSYSMRPRR
jgi:transcriptional regulator with XRE-family HTH domain